MNCDCFKFLSKSLLNPYNNCLFIFLRNSSKNKMLKFSTIVPFSCVFSSEDEKTRFSGFDGSVKDVIPLNPLVQSTKLISVLLL